MTLVEVSVGLALFTLVAVSLLGSVVHSRRLSTAALFESSALVAAQGYMEQMKTIPFTTLFASRKDASSPQTINTMRSDGSLDPLTPSSSATPVSNSKVIDVFGRYKQGEIPTGAKDVMPMTFTVTITNLSTGADDNRLLIQLDYTWQTNSATTATRSSSFTLVRSNVRSYVN